MSGRRKRLSPNAIVRGADYNALLDLLEANQNIRVGPGLQMHRTAGGTFISQMNRGEPQFQGRRGDDKIGGGGNVITFPAVILDSLGWQDNVTLPPLPPANKYVWRYLVHMCNWWMPEGDRFIQPMDATLASPGSPNLYAMPWAQSGWGWSFVRDHDYYMGGGMLFNGVPVRGWAWNTVEHYNNGLLSFQQGNGVDMMTLQQTNPNLDIQPVPVGTVVMVTAMGTEETGFTCLFGYENGIDGICGS